MTAYYFIFGRDDKYLCSEPPCDLEIDPSEIDIDLLDSDVKICKTDGEYRKLRYPEEVGKVDKILDKREAEPPE